MNKKVLSLTLVSLVMIPSLYKAKIFPVSQSEASKQSVDSTKIPHGNIYNYDELVTNDGWPWTAITKTITKNYNTPDVPAGVHYTQYIDSKWYSGQLKASGEVKKISDNIWQASYKGKINYQNVSTKKNKSLDIGERQYEFYNRYQILYGMIYTDYICDEFI